MSDKKPMYDAFTSPAGEAVFPWITRADTTYDATGLYHCDLSVPFELAQDFIAKLESTRDAFIATLPVAKQQALAPRAVYKEELTRPEYPEDASDADKQAIRDAWVGEPTGNVLFKFKLKAKVQPKDGDGWTQKPVVVAADTGEAVESPVFGGSIIRVRGQIVPYTNDAAQAVGVTLRMKAVQVIELVTGDGSGSGFWTDFDNEAA
jgi:hypothetical protein